VIVLIFFTRDNRCKQITSLTELFFEIEKV
jgi:hypothetical protein